MQPARFAVIQPMPLWIIVVCGMAVAAAFAADAMLEISDVLPSEIAAALKPVEKGSAPSGEASGLEIVHVGGIPTGVARGIQLGLLGLLLGGVPAGFLGAALLRWSNREGPRSEEWGNAFLAGFVFQLSSLVLTTLLLALFVWAAYDSAAQAQELILPPTLLLFAVAIGIWGLRSWRVLQLQVEQTVSIIPLGVPANRPLQPTSGAGTGKSIRDR